MQPNNENVGFYLVYYILYFLYLKMNRCCAIVSLMLAFFISTVQADGLYVGFCNGQIGASGEGISGSHLTISEATFLKPSDLASYSKQSITAINAGLVQKAASYPDSLTVWVRASRDGENLASGKASAVGGWNFVSLDKSIALDKYASTGLWIGFSFAQTTKKNVIAFLPNPNGLTDCGWLAKNDTWTDRSATKGILPIEAWVEGEGLPTHNLSILNAQASPEVVKLGNDITFKVRVRNNASSVAENAVLKVSLADGAITGETKVKNLKYREETTVSLVVPSAAITEECEMTAKFSLSWGDGSVDDYPADNEAEALVTFSKNVFLRNMLVEEATGAWCGFCVRGIVGMRTMRERYPDRFIGIGVHNGDAYVVSAYDSWIGGQISGYPSCVINRNGKVYDPSTEELEAYYKSMDEMAEGGIEVSGLLTNGNLTLNSSVAFGRNMTDRSFNVVYVVVEDQLPITQSNYFSGGGYGPMDGFENQASKVKLDIDDVARGVYPAPGGAAITLPAEIIKNECYNHTLEVKMPTVENMANTFLVAILLDGKTGQVVNAAKGQISDSNSIFEVKSNAHSSVGSYNLMGQPVSASQKGLIIQGGKKMIRY